MKNPHEFKTFHAIAAWVLVLACGAALLPPCARAADLELKNTGDQADCTVGIATFGDIRFTTTISGNGSRPGVIWRDASGTLTGSSSGVTAPAAASIPGLAIDSRIPQLPGQGNTTAWSAPKAAWYFNDAVASTPPAANDPVAMLNGYYQRWLGRDVDPGEVAAGLDMFTRSGLTEDQINGTFQNSTEYKVRQVLLTAGIDNGGKQRDAAGAVDRGDIPRPGRDFNDEVIAYASGRWP